MKVDYRNAIKEINEHRLVYKAHRMEVQKRGPKSKKPIKFLTQPREGHYKLIRIVLERSSTGLTFQQACKEWIVINFEDHEQIATDCDCGHEDIRYQWTLYNVNTRYVIESIGSKCIYNFPNVSLCDEVKAFEGYLLADKRDEIVKKINSNRLDHDLGSI